MGAPTGAAAPRTRLFINGRWEEAARVMRVTEPWTGRLVAEMACGTEDDLDRAVAAAAEALSSPLPAAARARVLDRAAGLVEHDAEAIARTIASEVAKPIRLARAEVARCVETLRFSSAEARTLAGHGVPLDAHPAGAGLLGFTLRVPAGVVGAITPFNFPLNLVAHKLGPALAAGCPVVLKPAEKAPLSAVRLVEVFERAGLPPGWLNLVTGDGPGLGRRLATHPDVAVVTFTGSSAVGWSLRAAAPRKKVLLELGSSAPLIVEVDADVPAAADRIAQHAFGHAGQSCVAVQRVLVHRERRDELVDALLPRVEALRLGDPSDEDTDVSVLIDEVAAARVHEWVTEAAEAGAKVLVGGWREGALVAPTVVADTSHELRLWCQEVFGPVVVVNTFEDTSDAIAAANGVAPGLNAGVFTADLARALRYVQGLRYGTVLVNESPTFRVDQMPYGGEPDAGNTREGPAWAVRELTLEKLAVVRPAP